MSVEQPRTVGISPMYRIDSENAAVEDLEGQGWDLPDQLPESE
ncbi:hypothetical protein [Salinarchaeum chitinilyticum]